MICEKRDVIGCVCAVCLLHFLCRLLLFYNVHFTHIFRFSLSFIFALGARLNYVQCIGCSLVLVYKSRTGTASLLRHRCQRFPISVYDLKLENHRAILAAAGQLNLLSEMASSNNEQEIELKQEMLTDEEESEEQEPDDDNQFSNEQTNKGLLESFSLLEKTFITGDELLLSREEIEHAKRNNDPDLFFER